MSTTGDRDAGQPHAEGVGVLYKRPPTERDAYIAHTVEVSRAIGSPSLFDEDLARAKASLAFERGLSPDGTGRQMLAIIASGSRSDDLRRIDIPTLVIHGDADPLVDPTGGRRTAEVIPGAELIVLAGMGHDLPAVYWSTIVEAVTALASRADGVSATEAH
jgi:pimeloyl-ACP methyl ester carboxylesterase